MNVIKRGIVTQITYCYNTYDVSVERSALLLSFNFVSEGECVGSGEFGIPDIGSIELKIFSDVLISKDSSKKLSKKPTTLFISLSCSDCSYIDWN
jgi:hypothetical protein